MSPRAAWRLERFGFEVYDYAAGKADWLAAGLPTVRAAPGERRALDVADRHPRTCPPDTRVDHVECPAVVVNDHLVVLGRIRCGEYAPGARAEDVMEPGPTTVRAHDPLDPLLERMRRHDTPEVLSQRRRDDCWVSSGSRELSGPSMTERTGDAAGVETGRDPAISSRLTDVA